MFKTLTTFGLITAMTIANAAWADEWRYAMEEGLTDPQGMYATKFLDATPARQRFAQGHQPRRMSGSYRIEQIPCQT